MITAILTVLLVLVLKIGMDILFLIKLDSFNRASKVRYLIMSFLDTGFGIFGLKIVLDIIDANYWYVAIYAFGAVIAGLISSKIKAKLDDKLDGQRKFYARITFDDSVDESEVVEELTKQDFDFAIEKQQYTSGKFRTVIQGSLENRQRMWALKDILRGRKGKHLVIMRAEDIFYLP